MKRWLLTLATAAAVLGEVPAQANMLIEHVDGLTVDADGRIDRFNALLIGNDGKIEQVLHRTDKRPAKIDYQIDGEGRIMMPGLIDSHAHIMSIGFAALTLDLSDTHSLAEAQTRIAAYVTAHPDRPWVLGRGWNQETWGLKRFPTAAELDEVSGGHPAWLVRVDGHAGWANTVALNAAGVNTATKDPAGGKIERILPTLKPAGVLIDAATDLVSKIVPPPRPEDRDLALDRAQNLLAAKGVTAVADMGTSIENWQAFRRAGDLGTLRIRIMAYAAGTEAMMLIGGPGPTPWLYDDRLRLNGVKLFADGALGSRGALLKAPYADDPASKGNAIVNGIQLRNMMSRAAVDHFQVAVHAIGDGANAAVLDAIDEMAGVYQGDRRWRIEHAQVIDPADIGRFGANVHRPAIIASMQPVHQSSDRIMAEARLGPARISGAYAWKSLTAAGAYLAFGSDAPVESPDPFAGMATAITRQGADGQPFGGWQPQERITREAALAAYTTGGAWAGFAEGRFGILAKGAHADFLLVDRDPMLATPAELRKIRVLETWIGGKRVFEAAGANDADQNH